MSKLGLLLMLAFLTLGVLVAGCIVEYDANEAGAGASTGGARATGGAGSSKGGSGTSGAATSDDGGGGCSFSRRPAQGTALGFAALSLGLALGARRRRRAAP
ncbi:MAG TPA: hypothetical protein VG937_36860 [Polyangiaceae bacterium]|nr:hypothetical protein [Polyangiaceae bacterium]